MLPKPKAIFTGLFASLLISFVYLGFGRLPVWLRYGILWVFGKAWFQLAKSQRNKTIANLKLVKPGLVNKTWEDAAWVNFKTRLHSYATLFGAGKADLSDLRSRITGAEEFFKACDEGPVVGVFPHIYDLNALMATLAALEREAFIPVMGINPILYQLIAGLRGRHGNIEFAPIRKGRTKEVCYKKLSEGKIVGLAMDMTTKPGKGVACTIGTGTADFRVGAVEIAMTRRARLFLAFPYSNRGKMYLDLEPFDLDYSRSVDDNVQMVVESYETFLKEHVLHWWRLAYMDMRPAYESAQELGFR